MATVLAVDDEEDILTIIRHNLEHEGHRVLTAPNGDRALEIVRDEHPDVVDAQAGNGISFIRCGHFIHLSQHRELYLSGSC